MCLGLLCTAESRSLYQFILSFSIVTAIGPLCNVPFDWGFESLVLKSEPSHAQWPLLVV